VGKGTQAERLKADLGLTHLATGDILRQEVADSTALGVEAQRFMNDGQLVPDEVVIGMIKGRLDGAPDDFLLDGFPRTIAQAEALDVMLNALGAPLEAVVSLLVPHDELTRRLGGRWLCRRCGRSYHEVSNPYRSDDLCPVDGGQCDLYQRADDRPETIAARLETYTKQTAPVVGYYRERGVLCEIDGTGELDAVYARIRVCLGL
jgi:adenylate kinase